MIIDSIVNALLWPRRNFISGMRPFFFLYIYEYVRIRARKRYSNRALTLPMRFDRFGDNSTPEALIYYIRCATHIYTPPQLYTSAVLRADDIMPLLIIL